MFHLLETAVFVGRLKTKINKHSYKSQTKIHKNGHETQVEIFAILSEKLSYF